MSGLKTKLYEICAEVASEFPDWEFSSGEFRNKSLQHSTLIIDPGFGFALNYTPLQPAVVINHKKSMALFKKLNGYKLPTSTVQFQDVPQLLKETPERLRRMCSILADKNLQMKLVPPSEEAKELMIDITESRPVLRAVVKDGIDLLRNLYHLESEVAFLRNFPPKYTPGSVRVPYGEFEKSKGVMVCIVRVLIGDFDFVYKYRDDSYRTTFPKKTDEIDNLINVVPELKIRYAKTGGVI